MKHWCAGTVLAAVIITTAAQGKGARDVCPIEPYPFDCVFYPLDAPVSGIDLDGAIGICNAHRAKPTAADMTNEDANYFDPGFADCAAVDAAWAARDAGKVREFVKGLKK
jgi:hypothetical protein